MTNRIYNLLCANAVLLNRALLMLGTGSLGFIEGLNEVLKSVSLIVSITVGCMTAVHLYRKMKGKAVD